MRLTSRNTGNEGMRLLPWGTNSHVAQGLTHGSTVERARLPQGRMRRDAGCGASSMMIQCHGIGVIDPDEWIGPDPQAYIPIPSIVQMTKIINLRAARKR